MLYSTLAVGVAFCVASRPCASRRIHADLDQIHPEPENAPRVPAEFAVDIPSGAILVSEAMISACNRPVVSSVALGCQAAAMAQIACAALHAGGVELWVIVAADMGMDTFLSHFTSSRGGKGVKRDLYECVRGMVQSGLVKTIVNEAGSQNPWVRDFAPTLTVTKEGAPSELLVLPFKKFRKLAEPVQMQLARALGNQTQRLSGVAPRLMEFDVPKNKEQSCSFDWGNFDTDGSGLCLISDYGNAQGACPGLDRFLLEHAGCTELPGELVPMPEQTRHIDIFARFVGARTLLMTEYGKIQNL